MAKYLRGQIAKKANLNVETLRYYEKIKLLPTPSRTEGGYRLYSDKILVRLEFIKQAKAFGFTLDEISQFFSIDIKRVNSVDIVNLIDEKTEEIDSKIFELRKIKEILYEIKNNKHCPIIQAYFDSLEE